MTNKELEAKIKELEEQNEKLKGEAAAAQTGANLPLILPDPSMTPMIPYVEKEFVNVRLFRDEYRYKEPLYVAINGKNWVIQRGVEVTLPKYVADFIEQQMAEEAKIWERVALEEKEFIEKTPKQG